MKIVVINGSGGVGKDEFVKTCQRIRPNAIRNISIIGAVKTQARYFDWHGEKTDKARRFLSDLKDAWERYNDGPYDIIKWRIDAIKNLTQLKSHSTDNLIIFVHAREPNDIERFVKDYNAFTLLIRRPNVERTHGNHADDCVEEWTYDMIYENTGSLEDMEEEARMVLNYIDNNAKEAPEE